VGSTGSVTDVAPELNTCPSSLIHFSLASLFLKTTLLPENNFPSVPEISWPHPERKLSQEFS
jgi:hypothetical protein